MTSTHRTPATTPAARRRLRRFMRLGIAGVAASALLVSACGDEESSATTVEAPDSGGDEADGDAVADGAPNATLPEDLPEEVVDAYAPMEFRGPQLPLLVEGEDPDPAVGTPAPTFIAYDIDGNVYDLDPKTQGKSMVIMLAHHCQFCNKEVPVINELAKNGDIPDDLNVVAVLTDPDPTAPGWPPDQWIRDMKWPYEAVKEGLVAAEIDGERQNIAASMAYYGFTTFPSVVLIDEEGNVAGRWSGALGGDAIKANIQSSLYS